MMTEGRVLKKGCMKVDMISKLPDDVLVNILSFLKLNEAATTALVSHRWLHLWKHTPKLIFKNHKLLSDDPQKVVRYVNWVNSVLNLHKGDLQEFTIHFNANKSNRDDVAKWLEFAFSRRVEKLDFNWNVLDLIDRFDDALLLEEIISENITLIPTSTSFQSLKVMCLRQIKTSADAIQFFLGNCPLLERLVIENAIITSDLEVVGPSLKHLDILPHYRNISIRVTAPNLTFLKISCDTRRLFLNKVPKLVSMVFSCRSDCAMHDFATAASQLETLTISLANPNDPFLVPEMPKLKKLVIDDRNHLRYGIIVPFPLTSFLRASPCLEEFEVKITRLTLEEGISEAPKVGPVFKHSSLVRFKLLWFCVEQSCENRSMELVRYVVGSCVALEEIYISQCHGKQLMALRDVVDCCVHVKATKEERATFEKIIQLQLPAHIKLIMGCHYHKTPYKSTETTCPRVSYLENC